MGVSHILTLNAMILPVLPSGFSVVGERQGAFSLFLGHQCVYSFGSSLSQSVQVALE